MRNTFANVLSKNQVNYQNPGGKSALPSLDPASTANYYSQLAGLYAGYQNQLIALKQQRIGAKADFRDAAAQIRAQKVSDLASVENAAIERGVVGSSADLQNRIAVRGAAAAGIQSAKRGKLEAIAGTRIAAQQAGIDYFMGVQGLEAQKLAQQQQLLAQQLERNLIISGQETQMDALKGIYESLSQAMQQPSSVTNVTVQGGSGGWRKRYEAWLNAQQTYGQDSAGPVHGLGPHPH
jgi:hypothetical protein